jgi:hypothetical protein
MRKGCISLGDARCSICQRSIPYLERYLSIDEKDGAESPDGDAVHYCLNCALEKGYARYKTEKDEKMVTFFID